MPALSNKDCHFMLKPKFDSENGEIARFRNDP